MTDKNSISNEIIKIVKSVANNNPACEEGRITRVSGEYCNVELMNGGYLNNVRFIGTAVVDGKVMIVYPNGEISNPLCLAVDIDNTVTNIRAMGCGLFTIRGDGHLYVELPVAMENIFSINSNGHLIVSLPTGASNDYILKDDKHLYYGRED